MKRFITYLYEYEGGRKIKNTGFIRVDERNGAVNMQVCVRNYIRSHEKGKIYAYIWDNRLIGIGLGEVGVIGGQGDVSLRCEADNIMDSGYDLEKMAGIGVWFSNKGYLASCWNDNAMEAVGKGAFTEWAAGSGIEAIEEPETIEKIEAGKEIEEIKEIPAVVEKATEDPVLSELGQEAIAEPSQEVMFEPSQEVVAEPIPEVVSVASQEIQMQAQMPVEAGNSTETTDLVTYQKIELNQIRSLPSPNWYLCNNRFLIHGFFNYGYLILKKTMEADDKRTYLGIPGVFEKPEMVMAALFGFPEFAPLPKEVQTAQMEEVISLPYTKNEQGAKPGAFGCWFISLEG